MKEPLKVTMVWGKEEGEIKAFQLECSKCGRRIRHLRDGFIQFASGPAFRCKRKRCIAKENPQGIPWLSLDIFFEDLLMGLGVKAVRFKLWRNLDGLASLSRSEWELVEYGKSPKPPPPVEG